MNSSLTVSKTGRSRSYRAFRGMGEYLKEAIKMRRSLLGFALLSLWPAFSCTAAHAQTTIDFNIDPGGVTFTTGAGGSVIVTISAGNGSATWGSSPGKYTLTGDPETLTETSSHSNSYTFSGAPLTLTLNSTSGPKGSLTGIVTLVPFTQTSKDRSFNDNLVADVTISSASGSLDGKSKTFVLSLDLGNCDPIGDLKDGHWSNTDGDGSLIPTPSPTPEPASMLLFGSGLLVLGGMLRRRMRAA